LIEVLRYRRRPPNLSPTAGADIEWWFIQGRLHGATLGQRHVMAAFFMMRSTSCDGPGGAMLLQHSVDDATGADWMDSRVTEPTVAHHAHIADRVIAGSFPWPLRPLARRRHFAEIRLSVQRRGIAVGTDEPELYTRPFCIAWNGFRLAETADGFALRAGLAHGVSAELSLAMQGSWLDERSDTLNPDYGTAEFSYQCCPRLIAEGTVDGSPVMGDFWIDRQWGKYDGWLLSPVETGYRVLGWDWLGLNLEDGSDLLVNLHRDAASGRLILSFGICFENGVPRRLSTAKAIPERYWISPATGARYPVEWHLSVPELELEARITPVCDDQEIPVYGTVAVWEGAVRLQGTRSGATIAGRGRLELAGYGAPLTIAEHLRRSFRRVVTDVSAGLGIRREKG